MSYPEGLSAEALCAVEGHDWCGGGACVRCGERLRCGCGRFAEDRAEWWTEHFKVCPIPVASGVE